MAPLQLVNHPLVAVRLAVLRAQTTETEMFRRALQELALLLFMEASRGWATAKVEITTPLRRCEGAVMSRPIILVPILRAGLGLVDGILRLVPDAAVGHIGLYRNEETLRPVSYFARTPANLGAANVVLLDPMLATGHSACAGVALLKERGATAIHFICVVACTTGIAQLQQAHPDVAITAAAIDPELNARGYIVPGLGDAGDRYFATG